ncbi:hypothetical protein MWU65_02695 [Cellulophaga sp. F20128]|uniref:hypothetical protein n=1 Tax=Cellulophaga sp. F20128 TaxID=2926413 RepID=UPI001FF46972|nr:hypothetical protein [Cellulophaga sp. F20128]MCK0156070.1 hypothetical protein [Cellulophaga sp. F20128]
MKLREILLSVFSLVMIGFLFLGSQNIHAFTYHSADEANDVIVHCEQCDFIYTNNHTSFINHGCTQLTIYPLKEVRAIFAITYNAPYTQSTHTSYYLNRPPPAKR